MPAKGHVWTCVDISRLDARCLICRGNQTPTAGIQTLRTLAGLRSRSQPVERRFRPDRFQIVEFIESRHAFRQHDPGLLGGGEDMHIGGAGARVVQGADADEPAGPEAAGVLAPYIGAAVVAKICGMLCALEMDCSRGAVCRRPS